MDWQRRLPILKCSLGYPEKLGRCLLGEPAALPLRLEHGQFARGGDHGYGRAGCWCSSAQLRMTDLLAGV